MTKDMFETALRAKLRFTSVKGPLTLEQLFDVPLRGADGYNLNEIAKTLNTKVREASEVNFVDAKVNPELAKFELAFEIVKYVIASKVADEDAKAKEKARRAERDLLLEALDQKKTEAIASMSKEDIMKRLNALEAKEA